MRTDSSVRAAAFLVSLPEKPAWMERFHLLRFLPLSLVCIVSRCFFHSKHVVALGGSHPAASSQCSGVGVREVGRRDSVWGCGVAEPENLRTARPVLRNI